MKRTENRLELVDPDLSLRLARASDVQLRRIAVVASTFALERTGLDNPDIQEARKVVQEGKYGDHVARQHLQTVVDALDQHQWQLRDLADEGKTEFATYMAAFRRARAAHSLLYAFDTDPFVSAVESIYEANAATNDLFHLRLLILSVLDKML